MRYDRTMRTPIFSFTVEHQAANNKLEGVKTYYTLPDSTVK